MQIGGRGTWFEIKRPRDYDDGDQKSYGAQSQQSAEHQVASLLAVAGTLPAADADLGVRHAAGTNGCAASPASEIRFDLRMVSALHFPP